MGGPTLSFLSDLMDLLQFFFCRCKLAVSILVVIIIMINIIAAAFGGPPFMDEKGDCPNHYFDHWEKNPLLQ